jgi:adenylylsulfate kinase-like enzyme
VFIEVFVKCPIHVLVQRDVKGLYRKALAGEIEEFTGISNPYEEPLAVEVIVETDRETIAEGTAKIICELERQGVLPVPANISVPPLIPVEAVPEPA